MGKEKQIPWATEILEFRMISGSDQQGVTRGASLKTSLHFLSVISAPVLFLPEERMYGYVRPPAEANPSLPVTPVRGRLLSALSIKGRQTLHAQLQGLLIIFNSGCQSIN